MIAPASKSKELINQFMLILDSGRTLQGVEELQYLRELKPFPENELDGAQLRAFYYACNGNTDRAIQYFRQSLAFNEVSFIGNYLIYLIKSGYIRDYITETQKANNQLPHNPKLLRELFRAYSLSANITGLSFVIDKLTKLAIDDVNLYEEHKESVSNFVEGLKVSQEDLKFIIDTVVNIADLNRVEVFDLIFEYEDGFYSISLPTSCKDSKLIAQMNKELADKIAANENFIGKAFAPIIHHYIPKIMKRV